MKILLDHCTPAPLRHKLTGHHVATALDLGWSELTNGELLRTAAGAFDVMITTDQSLRHQQNLAGGKLAIIVLSTASWPTIQMHVELINSALANLKSGEIVEIAFPR